MDAHRRVRAVAFDAVETMFSLDAVAGALDNAGAGPGALERFFTQLLRDGFALAASGSYRPFREVADSALATVAPQLDEECRSGVLQTFQRLEPHLDVAPALERLAAADIPMVVLTNGSADLTAELLERAGVDGLVRRVISVEEAQRWKPAPAPYRHAAALVDVAPDRVALAAVHGWDVHGARRAGLITGWASRLERKFPTAFEAPDVEGPDLVAVVDALLALEASG